MTLICYGVLPAKEIFMEIRYGFIAELCCNAVQGNVFCFTILKIFVVAPSGVISECINPYIPTHNPEEY